MLQSGELSLVGIGPRCGKTLRMPELTAARDLKPGAEYFALMTLCLASDTPWACKGHVITQQQFAMPYGAPKPLSPLPEPSMGTPLQVCGFRQRQGVLRAKK